MTDDKQRQVKTARDALMRADPPLFDKPLPITVEPCPKCGYPGGEQVVHVCGPDDGALIAEAIEALIEWHVTSGVDKGDRLRNAAKKLWEMRETRT